MLRIRWRSHGSGHRCACVLGVKAGDDKFNGVGHLVPSIDVIVIAHPLDTQSWIHVKWWKCSESNVDPTLCV